MSAVMKEETVESQTVTCQTSAFLRALSLAGRAVARSWATDAVKGVQIIPDPRSPGRLQVVGTDLDLRLSVDLPVEPGYTLDLEGFILPDPQRVMQVIKKLAGKSLTLMLDAGTLHLFSGALDMEIPVLPGRDFPTDWPQQQAYFQRDLTDEALQALRRVRPAASREETRYYLNGIYLESTGNPWSLRAVATDGHRLFLARFPLPGDGRTIENGGDQGVILPLNTVDKVLHLARELGEEDPPLRMQLAYRRSSNSTSASEQLSQPSRLAPIWSVSGPDWQLSSKVIDGTFPNYHAVIPQDTPQGATFERRDLLRAAEAMDRPPKSGEYSRSALALELSESLARLSCAWDYGAGRILQEVPCQGNVTELKIGCAARYLAQALKAFPGCDKVSLAFCAPEDPEAEKARKTIASHPFVVASSDDADFQVVQMPMRI